MTDLQNQATGSEGVKDLVVQDFYQQLNNGEFVEDYAAGLQDAYEAAKANGEIDEPTDFQQELPEVPASCEELVTDLRTQIADEIIKINDNADFVKFTETSVCTGLANDVAMILDMNSGLVQGATDRNNALLADLILIEGEGLEADAFLA